MRDRRRALAAIVLLIVAIAWTQRPVAMVAIDRGLSGHAAATAEAALDLGVLGSVALSWTARRLTPAD